MRLIILYLHAFSHYCSDEEWGEFLHHPNRKFYDFNEIREEIIREARVTEKNKKLSTKAIHLKIYSTNVADMTLVDLPGFDKISLGGFKLVQIYFFHE